jgi:Fe2+ transport system protein FeoA
MRSLHDSLATAATLADMTIGACAKVANVQGQPALKHRLLEMGVTPGCRVRLVRVAPLGDPLDFELRGYHLSLRRDEARYVAVEGM